jgi:hypothetical protein
MTALPNQQPHRRLKAIAGVIQAILLAAAVTYIVWTLAGQWQSLRRHVWTLRAAPAILSLPLAAGWFLCRAWLWQLMLRCFGFPLAYRRTFRTFVLAELSRYLPGTVWHVFGRSYYSSRQGVPAAATLTAMVLEMALVALTAVAFFPLRALGAGRLFENLAIWAAAAVFLVLVIAHPRAIIPLVNLALRRLGKPMIQARLRYGDISGMFALCILMWLSLCAGFVLLASGITRAAAHSLIPVAASFPAAWFVGLIAIASPGGLGVREGVLAALLAGLLPGGMGVVVAIASRLWLTGIELLCAVIAWRIHE